MGIFLYRAAGCALARRMGSLLAGLEYVAEQKEKRGRKQVKRKYLLTIAAVAMLFPQAVMALSLQEYVERYNPEHGMFISREIKKAGDRYKIDPLFLASVYYTESRFSNAAISAAGAVGIAQLMPGTAAEMGADPYDPAQNIDGGAGYLRRMIDQNLDKGEDALDYALAAYNAGPGNVENGIPSYTYDYIRSVESEYQRLRREIREQEKEKKTYLSPQVQADTRRARLLALLRNRLREKQKAIAQAQKPRERTEKRPDRTSDIFF